jgi:hypothetical protein
MNIESPVCAGHAAARSPFSGFGAATGQSEKDIRSFISFGYNGSPDRSIYY